MGGTLIICFNRCLYCGRRTPHEVCHLHSRVVGGRNRIGSGKGDFTTAMTRAWKRHFGREPEVCEDDSCPQKAVDWQ